MKEMHLLKNNIVYTPLKFGCPDYGALILPVSQFAMDDYVYFSVPYNDSETWETESINTKDINGVPLTFTALFELFGVKLPNNIPPHIQYFHELQNWYYYTTGKHFIDLSAFDDRDGDAWIDITKQYRAFCGVDDKELYELRNPA